MSALLLCSSFEVRQTAASQTEPGNAEPTGTWMDAQSTAASPVTPLTGSGLTDVNGMSNLSTAMPRTSVVSTVAGSTSMMMDNGRSTSAAQQVHVTTLSTASSSTGAYSEFKF